MQKPAGTETPALVRLQCEGAARTPGAANAKQAATAVKINRLYIVILFANEV